MNEPTTSAKLTREMKVLLLSIMKAGELTKETAEALNNRLIDSGFIHRVSINFVDYSQVPDE